MLLQMCSKRVFYHVSVWLLGCCYAVAVADVFKESVLSCFCVVTRVLLCSCRCVLRVFDHVSVWLLGCCYALADVF